MIVYVSLLVALVGALVYGISANPKAAELGRLMFGCGLLAFLISVGSGHVVKYLLDSH